MATPQAQFRHGDEVRQCDYTPTSAVAGGDVIVIGTTPFIAHLPIAANALGSVAAGGGVYRCAKATGTAIAGGTVVYWDDAANQITATASSNAKFGFTVPAGALSADAFVDVVHRPN